MSDHHKLNHYLVLKLQGVMQAWGGHTMEDLRHTERMPTRSGIVGLLAACLGIDRHDYRQLDALAQSLTIAIRADKRPKLSTQRLTDFHTVMDARKVDGKRNKYPVVSRREYLCDAVFTVLLEVKKEAAFSQQTLVQAIKNPIYTPFLGRRSCPISRPLYEAELQADTISNAFSLLDSLAGTVYSEHAVTADDIVIHRRDAPLYARQRQFATHQWYMHPFNPEQTTQPTTEDSHVPK